MTFCLNPLALLFFLIGCVGLARLHAQAPDTTLAQGYLKQGQAGILSGRIDSAIYYYELAAKHYRQAKAWESYVHVANQLGESCIYLTRNEEGLAWLDTAQGYGLRFLGKSHALVADTYNKRGVYHFYRGDFDEGLPYMRRALAIQEAFPPDAQRGIAETLNSIGFYFQHMGDLDSAIHYYQRALGAWIRAGGEDHANVAVAYNNIGFCYRTKADNDRGLEYYQRALHIRLKTLGEAHPYLAASYSNIGACYQDQGDYSLANEHYFKALAIQLKSLGADHPNVATTYVHVGTCYGMTGDEEQELKYLNKALAIRKAALGPDHPRVAEVLSQLGHVYGNRNAPLQQLEYAQQALEIWKNKLGEGHFRVAFALNNIGQSYGRLGKMAQECEAYEQALDRLLKTTGAVHPLIARQYFLLGGNRERVGDPAEALQLYQQALSALHQDFRAGDVRQNPPAHAPFAQTLTVELLTAKARAYLKVQGRGAGRIAALRTAAEMYHRADELVQLMRSNLQASDSRQALSAHSAPLYEAAIGALLELHEHTGEQEPLHRAFAYCERNKALLLQESLRESRARQFSGLPDSVLQQEVTLRIDLAFYEKSLFDLYQKPTAIRDSQFPFIQEKLFALKAQYRALIKRLERTYPDYFRLKYDLKTASAADVQQWLRRQPAQVVHYFWGDTTLFVFAVGPQTIRTHRVSLHEGLETVVRDLLGQLSDATHIDREGNSPEAYHTFTRLAHQLYRQLLEPVLDADAPELVIIPDGPLNYLPFEILLKTPAQAQVDYLKPDYLFRSSRLRYAHSAGLLIDDAPHSARSAQRFAGFAPVYDKQQQVNGWGNLPGNQPEVAHIAALMEGASYLAYDATESAFIHRAPEYELLHLATHALLNDQNPLYSALVFSRGDSSQADDGLLHVYEIYPLRLQAHLAVLSACETGRGRLARGEGVMSLARAFRYAGCPNIVTSLWQTDDRTSRELMKAFYLYLAQGLAKDEALRLAKLEVLRSSSQQHPHYWAAFVLIGDNQPLPAAGWWKQALLLCSGLILAGAIQRLRQKRNEGK